MQDLTGRDIGRYHIVKRLGEGGMATVYKAYDNRLERDVAIKVIRTEIFGQAILEPLLKRFEREAKALARMQHPHIVHINDYGEFENIPYLVMDYLPGGTLKELTGMPMHFSQAARLLAPVARALEYAHQEGIVHRDVKPANVLLTKAGAPMLTDFGIAKILETDQTTQLTSTGMSIGTPEYMSPEQWIGEISPKVDIYALGIMFYELVTGHRPYTADTPAAILIKVTNDPLPRPREFVLDLPEEVERILFKALAKQPENRYANMGELANELEKLTAGNFIKQTGSPGQEERTVALPVETVQVTQPAMDLSAQLQAQATPHPGPAARPAPLPSQQTKEQQNVIRPAFRIGLLVVLASLVLITLVVAGRWVFGVWQGNQTTNARQATQDAAIQTEVAWLRTTQTTGANLAEGANQTSVTQTTTSIAPIETVLSPTSAGDIPFDRVEFVRDITIPDGAVFAANTAFTKTWRIKNTGSSTWTTDYGLAFFQGDKLDAPDLVRLSGTFSPGSTVDISVDMVAPDSPGLYKGFWRMVSSGGKYFDNMIYVEIKVLEPPATSTLVPTKTTAPNPLFTADQPVFCREGPSKSYDSPWQLNNGETVPVIGIWYQDSNWLLVDINSPQTRTDCCWVSGSGKLNVSLSSLKSINTIPDRMDCSSVK